jgi:hypothetical protein
VKLFWEKTVFLCIFQENKELKKVIVLAYRHLDKTPAVSSP